MTPAVAEMRAPATLRPNPLNPRTPTESDSGMVDLVASITAQGLLQPLLVTPADLIVAGHRRWIACRAVGLTEVPVLVRDLDEAAQLEAMLVENLQRRALNPVETARTCQALLDRGRTVDQVAENIGLGAFAIRRHLMVLALPEELQERVADGSLNLGHVEVLADRYCLATNPKRRIKFGLRAANEGWTKVRLYSAMRNGRDEQMRVRKLTARERRDQKIQTALGHLGWAGSALAGLDGMNAHCAAIEDLRAKLEEEKRRR